MQTFLPFPSFERSARVLDRQRLGKQRVEVLQLLNALLDSSRSAWRNHPACIMWEGHETALAIYGLTICETWVKLGYKDTCFGKIATLMGVTDTTTVPPMPAWYKRPEFHIAHQSNLLRKNEEFYREFFPFVPNNLPYWWPRSDEHPPQQIVDALATLAHVDGTWIPVNGLITH